MKKIILRLLIVIIIVTIIDIIFIFNYNKPLFAIEVDNNKYIGLFYNTYNCEEYSTPQIKLKTTKFNCKETISKSGKIVDIIDKTQDIKDFACAEALEEFYRDEEYTYYYNCIKGKYMIVKYESGYEEKIEDALKSRTITISDLDTYNINYIKIPNKE